MNELDHLSTNDSGASRTSPEHTAIRLSQESLLLAEDNLKSRLLRETEVMLGGAMLGLGKTAAQRIAENPKETLINAGTAGALTYAFVKLASSNLAPVRYTLPLLSGAMAYSFAANMASDLKTQANTLKTAWAETWKKPGSVDEQQTEVADSLGPFVFDLSLTITAGFIGGRIASNGIRDRAILNYMQEKYGPQIKESVFKIASEPGKGGWRNMGSSFAVDKDILGTAFHVVESHPGQTWTYLNAHRKGEAKILAGFPQRDLALLQTAEASFKQPLPIAANLDKLPQIGLIVGAPGGKNIEIKPATLSEARGVTGTSFRADLGPEVRGGLASSVMGGKGWPGMSGGPAISESGHVVGVITTLSPFLNPFGLGTNSVPAPTLRYFMNMLERSKQPGASMKLPEAAQTLGMSEAKILEQITKGKLEGFLVPSTNRNTDWEWRIMRQKTN